MRERGSVSIDRLRNIGAVLPERKPEDRPGFSLLEAVIAVSLLALMTFFGSLSLKHTAPRIRLHNAAWEIHSRLNWARYKAVYCGEKIKTVFEADGYTLFAFDAAQNHWMPLRSHRLEGVVVSASNSPIFHPGGTVSNLATIRINNSAGVYRITLAITGRIKLTKHPPD